MSFVKKFFSPIGAVARFGQVPAIFSYTSPDTFVEIENEGYFTDLGGTIELNDWVFVTAENAGTPKYKVLFFGANQVGVAVVAVNVVNPPAGQDYETNDIFKVEYTDGTVILNTLVRGTANGSNELVSVTIISHGEFKFGDPPTNLTGLNLINVSGGIGTLATVDVILDSSGTLGVYPQTMTAT